MNISKLPHIFRNAAFKQQLNIVVAGGILIFAVISSLMSSWQGSRLIRENLLEQGKQVSLSLAAQSTLALLYESPENAEIAMVATLAFPGVQFVEILKPDGVILAEMGNPTSPKLLKLSLDQALRFSILEAETENAWWFVAPVLSKAETTQLDVEASSPVLIGFVRVEQSKQALSEMQLQVFSANLGISLVFAAVLLLLLRHLANRITRPIIVLSDAMSSAEIGNLNVRANIDGPKDIVDMGVAFNSMISSLQDREKLARKISDIEALNAQALIIAEREHAEQERQKRFLAMLTHELKTPLSVIRLCLGAKQPSPRMLHHSNNAIDDIDKIIERVALATRIDDHSVEPQKRVCRVGELLAEVAAHFPNPTRVIIELLPEVGEVDLVTDPLLLRTTLGNLIDNALKYAAAESVVHVYVNFQSRNAKSGVVIQVENLIGPAGLPDPLQIFNKYYRAPGAHKESGSGLGLYIVQELVNLLGGHIGYIEEKVDTVCFELWIPMGTNKRTGKQVE